MPSTSPTSTSTFEYAGAEMRRDYEDMLAAQATAPNDMARFLMEQEFSARCNLGSELGYLRKEAASLADRAARIVSMIDDRGFEYRPNSLGEVQGHNVDTSCAKVYVATHRLEQAQKELRRYLDALEAEPVFPEDNDDEVARDIAAEEVRLATDIDDPRP